MIALVGITRSMYAAWIVKRMRYRPTERPTESYSNALTQTNDAEKSGQTTMIMTEMTRPKTWQSATIG